MQVPFRGVHPTHPLICLVVCKQMAQELPLQGIYIIILVVAGCEYTKSTVLLSLDIFY